MRLVIYCHKTCWPSSLSPSGYATDGGFPFQMKALSQLFDGTQVLVPCEREPRTSGVSPLEGEHLSVVPLTNLAGSGWVRKLLFPFWVVRNLPALIRWARAADVIHCPIPGDVGTIGMFLAVVLRRKLLVRHCGNWLVQQTVAERFWKWSMEQFRQPWSVMLATGAGQQSPSARNPTIRWIFSTALWEEELESCRVERSGQPRPALIIACRQDREKGTGIVIQALPEILEAFPDATLDVVGDGQDLDGFRALASRLSLDGHVRFHGKLSHDRVLRMLRQATLFCYPTGASEGFPKVILEALACALPVVTTRVSVLPGLISEGCGVLIDEQTPQALAAAVKGCLSNAELYGQMSRRAMETARQYSLERWRDTIGSLLEKNWGPLRAHA